MLCLETVSLIKDIALTIVSVVGATVAVKGLGTWKHQLKGKFEYDLSRRTLVSLFKFRDAINGVRDPSMWPYEIPSPPIEEAEKMNQDQLSFYGVSKAYQARWDKVQDERNNLYADLLESEALWGVELKDLFKVVYDLEHELFTNVRQHLDLINPSTHKKKIEAIEKFQEKRRDVLYDDSSDEDDEYKCDFQLGVEAIEKYLKPKLKH